MLQKQAEGRSGLWPSTNSSCRSKYRRLSPVTDRPTTPVLVKPHNNIPTAFGRPSWRVYYWLFSLPFFIYIFRSLTFLFCIPTNSFYLYPLICFTPSFSLIHLFIHASFFLYSLSLSATCFETHYIQHVVFLVLYPIPSACMSSFAQKSIGQSACLSVPSSARPPVCPSEHFSMSVLPAVSLPT